MASDAVAALAAIRTAGTAAAGETSRAAAAG
jgi:hypothetical protein